MSIPLAAASPARPLRICIVYDCLYPWSVGGAERWYRRLAERLAETGQIVTYLTTLQWPPAEHPDLPGVQVHALASRGPTYARGRRQIGPELAFAVNTWRHLLHHGRDYDVVHSSALSPFSALGMAAIARRRGFRLVLDWWEVWSWPYWRGYLGPLAGGAGWALQRALMATPHQPLVYARTHQRRLWRPPGTGPAPLLRGLLPSAPAPDRPQHAEDVVVFAGRHIPEKQVELIVPAIAIARERIPELRAILYGDGPSRQVVEHVVSRAGLDDAIALPGFVAESALRAQLGRALCLVLPSRREGFGLIVAEAAALGVPSVVLEHPDSAAGELIRDGVNGALLRAASPDEIASAILRVHDAGYALRQNTLAWFQDHAGELTIDGSLPRIHAVYRGEGNGAEGGAGW